MFKNFSKISRCLSWALFFILIFSLCWQVSFLSLDPDLGWHLKFGRDILLTHQVPRDQIQLWTINGTWVDHEWLTNLIMYSVYNSTGYLGLTALFALMATLGFYLIGRHLRRREQPLADMFIGALLLLGLAAVMPHLGPRPQQISFLLLIVELLWLKQPPIRSRWLLALMWFGFFWLWASLHAAFFIGLAVMALWAGNNLLTAWRRSDQRPAAKTALLSLLGAALATLLTPYGLKLYDFLTTYYNNYASLGHINEWRPVWVFPIHYWQLLFLAIIIAMAVVLLLFKRWQKITLWQWLTVAMFFVMGLQSVRHIPLFVVCATLLLAPEFINFNFNHSPGANRRSRLKLAGQILLPIILFGLAWLTLITTNFFNDPFQKFCADYPCFTAAKLANDQNYSQLKLLNAYNYGGWLIWTWPDKKLFIDGRLPQYPFGHWSLLEEYLEFGQADKTAAQLKSYNIEAVLWNNRLPQYHLNWLDKFLGFNEALINGRVDQLKKYLDASPDWRRVFSDDASSVYVRQDKL